MNILNTNIISYSKEIPNILIINKKEININLKETFYFVYYYLFKDFIINKIIENKEFIIITLKSGKILTYFSDYKWLKTIVFKACKDLNINCVLDTIIMNNEFKNINIDCYFIINGIIFLIIIKEGFSEKNKIFYEEKINCIVKNKKIVVNVYLKNAFEQDGLIYENNYLKFKDDLYYLILDEVHNNFHTLPK